MKYHSKNCIYLGKCFQILTIANDWSSARDGCKGLDSEADLATIYSKAENEFITGK